jgi:hypothetical protein
MTPLGQRSMKDLALPGYAKQTIEAYVRAVAQLARHCKCSPDPLTEEQVRDYLVYSPSPKKVARGTHYHRPVRHQRSSSSSKNPSVASGRRASGRTAKARVHKPTLSICPTLSTRSEAPPSRLLRGSLLSCQPQHLESTLRRRPPCPNRPPRPATSDHNPPLRAPLAPLSDLQYPD